jgi:hypothetical protein
MPRRLLGLRAKETFSPGGAIFAQFRRRKPRHRETADFMIIPPTAIREFVAERQRLNQSL